MQARISQLLLTAPLNLSQEKVRLEAPVGGGHRIDVEVGTTVIEVKKDLRVGNVREEAEEQLTGYVAAREKRFGCRYVGVLSDGARWHCYHLQQGRLKEVSAFLLDSSRPDAAALLAWLEGVLATTENVRPVPEAIVSGLGAGGSAHALDLSALLTLFQEYKTKPEVQTKRLLWARLLAATFGTQFEDTDRLFVEHTLLVNSASVIAHALLGIPVQQIPAASMLSGAKFEEAGIEGVIEADFFDWVLDAPKGDAFIQTLARRLCRFDWSAVEHDVLKVLYESIISAETRKKLGEYYTPDWLAQKMVDDVIVEPLDSTVLDPACGSGTFLFHAVRRYLSCCEENGIPLAKALDGVTGRVFGLDLHPVAVTLARVTYLLAIGRKRLLDRDRGSLRIPVYLGDAMQWSQWKQTKAETLWSHQDLTVTADDRRELTPTEFKFPRVLLRDFRLFDKLVKELAEKASTRKPGSPPPSLAGFFQRHSIGADVGPTLITTFHQMCRLHDEGRDHIWGYYIRNLAHPQWLAQDANRVDILIGNPPWLAFRHMPTDMQADFQAMSQARGLWHGGKVATQQDLSALFVARTVQLYLKPGGQFGFIMPSAALDRGQFKGFRAGIFDGGGERLRVAFSTPWDLRHMRPHFFPISAASVFGCKSAQATPLPAHGERWSGKLPSTGREQACWEDVASLIKRGEPKAAAAPSEESPYKPRFRNGATIIPRVLFMVERMERGPMGHAAGTAKVRSVRSANEKKPWKELPPLEGVVETEFLRPVHLGETVLPFRMLEPHTAVIPRDRETLMDGAAPRLELYPGLARWWRHAEQVWIDHRSSDRLTLMERVDFHGGMSSQFLSRLPQRIVYAKSGMHVAAARLSDQRSIIDHTLYWAVVKSDEEALYLCAVLNAAVTTRLVRPLMAYGKDERHVDKYIWKLPIPLFDENNRHHTELASLGKQIEEEIAALNLNKGKHFSAARRLIRAHLEGSATGQRIEEGVRTLLGSPTVRTKRSSGRSSQDAEA